MIKQVKDDAMTLIMTPSLIPMNTTPNQINKAVANYRALLERYSKRFESDAVQEVLGQPDFVGEQFGIFRRRVESASKTITRLVQANRSRTGQEAINATSRLQHAEQDVVDSMPQGCGDRVEIRFFKIDSEDRGYLDFSDDAIDREFELRGLKPADPYSVAAVNELDPAFADYHANCTRWRHNGCWCYAMFSSQIDRAGIRREVRIVSHRYHIRGVVWWFAGIRN